MQKQLGLVLSTLVLCWMGSLPFVNADQAEVGKKHAEKKSTDKTIVDKKPVEKKKEKMKMVELNTSMGRIVIQLNEKEAPESTKNFLKYVNDNHYSGTIFHRVIKGFMIQGGNMDKEMNGKATGKPIKNEAKNGLSNVRGTLAMARTSDPNSATDQFFINVVDNKFLDYAEGNDGYAVFGQVVEGMDIVDKIRAVRTGNKGYHKDVPVEPVTIESAKVLK